MSKCRRCDAGHELVFNSVDKIWLHILDVDECPNMANAHSFEQVYLLWVELSDGTRRHTLGGVFTSIELAEEAQDRDELKARRTYIEQCEVNHVVLPLPNVR